MVLLHRHLIYMDVLANVSLLRLDADLARGGFSENKIFDSTYYITT
jgi:hypothetical protein